MLYEFIPGIPYWQILQRLANPQFCPPCIRSILANNRQTVYKRERERWLQEKNFVTAERFSNITSNITCVCQKLPQKRELFLIFQQKNLMIKRVQFVLREQKQLMM